MTQSENEEASGSSENKHTECLKKIVKVLGKAIILLSTLMFFMSIAEVTIEACKEINPYWYDYLTTVCYPYNLWGAGIWCSIIPFFAGVFGVMAGSESSSHKKIGLLMGFSILGAMMLFVFIFFQSILITIYVWEAKEAPPKYKLQVAILCVASLNIIMLITSTAFSGCLCQSCCPRSRKSVEQRIVYKYVPNDPNQQVSN